uniref:Uncharacterized protein n=1 Tax=Sphenodon punctatus TaxID=8508 RepID=A0A8D0H1F6_SPHPU
MAAASPTETLQSELTCSVCLDYFKEPVSLGCGHNFCRACISEVWEGLDANFSCPDCREIFPQRNFKPNRPLRNIIKATQELKLFSAKEPGAEDVCEEHHGALQVFCREDQVPLCLFCHLSKEHRGHAVIPIEEAAQDYKDQIQCRLQVLEKEREDILMLISNGGKETQELLTHIQEEKKKSLAEFKQLHQFLEEQEQGLLARLEDLEKTIVQKHNDYIARLSSEISCLNSLIRDTRQMCHQPLRLFFQDVNNTLNRCGKGRFRKPVAFTPELKWRIWENSQRHSFLGKVIQQFKDTLFSGEELNKANVTLDPATANPRLVLSEDRRSVRWGGGLQDLPNNPERFFAERCVLGCEGFTSGRHCWEVEAEVGGCWAVGVARESVERKGDMSLTPAEGVWALGQEWMGTYYALTSPKTYPCLIWSPRRIRVYLDYAGGQVAFFDAETHVPIFTFPPASFSGERVFPFFWVWRSDVLGEKILPCTKGKGSWLTLCP